MHLLYTIYSTDPKDCQGYVSDNAKDGVYKIQPDSDPAFEVYCKFDGKEGWVVFQRRTGSSVSFNVCITHIILPLWYFGK